MIPQIDDTNRFEDEVTEFLGRVGADLSWEAAEKHALANMVVDSSKLVLNYSDKNTYCICCKMPYP